ncbi:Ubiquinone/menaquinone biosynthesis C-methyltransferase UbiE [bioreactor metagenome]|uniref:Ubiquinone/menaquinone biosynthesis C-methyltransferase UbiE n=1 Tax=bioreactor metagenome TaxID=1076179 RepID=A0A644ZF04_9ZZZZ
MNNLSNKKIYKKWSKIYDKFFGSSIFNNQRKLEIDLLTLNPEDKVLFIGIGTGEDFKFLPKGVQVTGIDITEEMLEVARKKADTLNLENANILNMDAMNLSFQDKEFDYVILNLILSVVPDGNKCLKEAYRVLKPNGKVAIFDKFAGEEQKKSVVKALLNKLTTSLGTDINRKFSQIAKGINLKVVEERKSIFRGMYKIMILEKAN